MAKRRTAAARTPRDGDGLGRKFLAVYKQIDALAATTEDAAARQELVRQRDRAWASLGDLVEAAIDQGTEEYRDATGSLDEAAAAIGSALQDMKRVAGTIRVIARALDTVGRLAAAG